MHCATNGKRLIEPRETDFDTDILIVGAGIAGSALACALRDSGLRLCLLEKIDAPLDTARGDHLQPRTCEVLQRWGVLDKFFEHGAEKRSGAIWYSGDGQEILRSSVKGLDIPHPYFAFINHELIGSVMLDAALESKAVQIVRPIRNWWRDDTDVDGNQVRVGLTDGREIRIRAKVIIGADGRSSRIRDQFGFETSSFRYERSIAVVFAAESQHDPERFLKVYLGDGLTTSVIPRTGNFCKIGIPVTTAEAREWRKANAQSIQSRLLELCPQLEISDPVFADIYPPVRLQAESWVRGSVALIGDACHAMHPARSQGMNIAIRCIDELADILGNESLPLSHDAAARALAYYESCEKPEIDAILSDNHQWGLKMDRADQDNQGLKVMLAKIQADSSALMAYSMQAAGYS